MKEKELEQFCEKLLKLTDEQFNRYFDLITKFQDKQKEVEGDV